MNSLFENVLQESQHLNKSENKKLYRALQKGLRDSNGDSNALGLDEISQNDETFEKNIKNFIEKNKDRLQNDTKIAINEYFGNKNYTQPKKQQVDNGSKKLVPMSLSNFINRVISVGIPEKNCGSLFNGWFNSKSYNCVYLETKSGTYYISIDTNTRKINGGLVNQDTFKKNKIALNPGKNTVQGKEQAAAQIQDSNITFDIFKNSFNGFVALLYKTKSKNIVLQKDKDHEEVYLSDYFDSSNIDPNPFNGKDKTNFIIDGGSRTIELCNVSPNLARTVELELQNYSVKYAQHPYLNQVKQEVMNNMKGNKYISVGNNAYKESIEFYKAAVKRLMENTEILKEDTNDITNVTDGQLRNGVNLIEEIYGTKKNLAWADKDFEETIKAAKNGDNSAVGYIMYKHAPMIVSTFWKNYLGPNKKMRAVRIEEDGGLKSSLLGWVGICLRALIKGGVDITKKNGTERHKFSTLEGFKLSKVTGDVEHQFSAHFRMDVIEQAKVYNVMHARNGVSGADGNDDTKITMTNLEFDNGRERTDGEDEAFMRDDLEDSVLDKISKDDFLKNWMDYCQDEVLLDGKKCSPSKALWALLSNPNATNLKAVAEDCGVARMTFETLVKKAISILPQYDIEYGDLMSACDRYGAAKIASYLAH